MKVAVGSKNPVKLAATKEVFFKVFEQEAIEFESVGVPSGVPDQPYGTEETKTGARNRALACLEAVPAADYGVGLEGGIEIIDEEYYVTGWMCVANRNGRIGFGRTSAYQLPPKIVELLQAGHELTDAGDIVFDDTNIGRKQGVISVLTRGSITRTDFYKEALHFALIPFINKDLYKK